MGIFDKLKQKTSPEERKKALLAEEAALRKTIRLNLEQSRRKAATVIRLQRNAIVANYGENVGVDAIEHTDEVMSIRKACYLLQVLDETEKLLNKMHTTEMLAQAVNAWADGMEGMTKYNRKRQKANNSKADHYARKVGAIEGKLSSELAQAITSDMDMIMTYADNGKLTKILKGEKPLDIIHAQVNSGDSPTNVYNIMDGGAVALEEIAPMVENPSGYNLL